MNDNHTNYQFKLFLGLPHVVKAISQIKTILYSMFQENGRS